MGSRVDSALGFLPQVLSRGEFGFIESEEGFHGGISEVTIDKAEEVIDGV